MMTAHIAALCRRALGSRLLRVATVGGVGVVAQTAIFETIGVYLGLVPLSTATLIGAEAGVVTSFALNNRYTFGDRVHDRLLPRLLRYHATVLGSLAIQWASIFAAEHATQNVLVLHVVYAAAIIAGFIWNYNWYRLWVWRSAPSAMPREF